MVNGEKKVQKAKCKMQKVKCKMQNAKGSQYVILSVGEGSHYL